MRSNIGRAARVGSKPRRVLNMIKDGMSCVLLDAHHALKI